MLSSLNEGNKPFPERADSCKRVIATDTTEGGKDLHNTDVSTEAVELTNRVPVSDCAWRRPRSPVALILHTINLDKALLWACLSATYHPSAIRVKPIKKLFVLTRSTFHTHHL